MINILSTLGELETFRKSNLEVGFVPTMGNLHPGHISLVEKALCENPVVVVSIFVNPKQFGEIEDLINYPRTLESDTALLQEALDKHPDKKLYIFSPSDELVIYPSNFNDFIKVDSLNSMSEGKIRPDHFDGVATVVKRLFKLISPTRAYFGKKDYQQFLVVKELIKQEKMNIEIIGMPIIREKDGLAMSSRNSRLNSEQRVESLMLSKSLLEILFQIQTNGFESAKKLIRTKLEDKRFNYLEIRNSNTFELAQKQDTQITILGNFQLGQTRLLDNIEVEL